MNKWNIKNAVIAVCFGLACGVANGQGYYGAASFAKDQCDAWHDSAYEAFCNSLNARSYAWSVRGDSQNPSKGDVEFSVGEIESVDAMIYYGYADAARVTGEAAYAQENWGTSLGFFVTARQQYQLAAGIFDLSNEHYVTATCLYWQY